MPYPPPATFQLRRCWVVAWNSRGYQVSGTEMVRPSFKRTLSESSSKDTSATVLLSKLLFITWPPRGRWRAALPFLLTVASRQRRNSPGIQIVLPRLVNHTKLLMLGGAVVWNHLIQLSQLQRCAVLLVLHANDESWFCTIHGSNREYA